MSNPSLPIQPQGQPYCNLNFESAYAPIYAAPAQTVSVKQKPEKPLLKTHIPGTDWLRITTTERNIFYFHRISKKSTWVVSDELKAVLDAFEVEEKVDEQTTAGKSKSKRKADEPTPAGKAVKKAKLYEPQVSEEETSDEEEEEWRSKAAEQLAAEAEDFRKLKEEEQKKQELQEAQRAFAASEIVMPRTVDLSVEESKALFKVCAMISNSPRLILLSYRHYFGRKILIPYTHGTLPFRTSYRTQDTYFYPLSRLVERLSMSIVKRGLESCERWASRKFQRFQIPRRGSTVY